MHDDVHVVCPQQLESLESQPLKDQKTFYTSVLET